MLEILDTAGQVRSSLYFDPVTRFCKVDLVLHILTRVFASATPQETFSAMRELYMKNGEVRKHSARTYTPPLRPPTRPPHTLIITVMLGLVLAIYGDYLRLSTSSALSLGSPGKFTRGRPSPVPLWTRNSHLVGPRCAQPTFCPLFLPSLASHTDTTFDTLSSLSSNSAFPQYLLIQFARLCPLLFRLHASPAVSG